MTPIVTIDNKHKVAGLSMATAKAFLMQKFTLKILEFSSVFIIDFLGWGGGGGSGPPLDPALDVYYWQP